MEKETENSISTEGRSAVMAQLLPGFFSLLVVLVLSLLTSCHPGNGSEDEIFECQVPEPACTETVTVVNSVCGNGHWRNLWFKTANGEYLQPCAVAPDIKITNLQEGQTYTIGYTLISKKECDNYAGMVCLAVVPPADVVKITCITPVDTSTATIH